MSWSTTCPSLVCVTVLETCAERCGMDWSWKTGRAGVCYVDLLTSTQSSSVSQCWILRGCNIA
jgi:hypothetical protein